ncbi:hypothetical protein [Streptomyces sp. ITFR-16]|uniref:hypothetical protein n=1 Tax=Streptomyces sp. ITFR-16 TaxID=3075198 RepID=UPI00288A35DF|nr:hypothetical protein [Streptomyces sp. ITFR-16]WNI26681.1 hypothetical protein RLT58_34495 [Streptomyces sp. ITFR-16]
MIHDLTELTHVAQVLEEAHCLLKAEQERLEKHYGPTPYGDTVAGSPTQTLHGIRDLASAVTDKVKWVALAAGYAAVGLDQRAVHALKLAKMNPVSFPDGADRMARPLGADAIRAMEMVRDLGFFNEGVRDAIDVAIAAPEATYPPADWSTYEKQLRPRTPQS